MDVNELKERVAKLEEYWEGSDCGPWDYEATMDENNGLLKELYEAKGKWDVNDKSFHNLLGMAETGKEIDKLEEENRRMQRWCDMFNEIEDFCEKYKVFPDNLSDKEIESILQEIEVLESYCLYE